MEDTNINNSTKQEILKAIDVLADKVSSMDAKIGSMDAKIGSLTVAQEATSRSLASFQEETDKTLHEVLETMNTFATDTEERFGRVEKDLLGLTTEVGGLKTDVGVIKATMVTKDYLDVKMGRLSGDMVAMVRKEDNKVDDFVSLLSDKKLLTNPEAKKIVLMGPFPKTG